jgi:hypothetical protein
MTKNDWPLISRRHIAIIIIILCHKGSAAMSLSDDGVSEGKFFVDKLGTVWDICPSEMTPWLETADIKYEAISEPLISAGKEGFLCEFEREPTTVVVHSMTNLPVLRHIKTSISGLGLDLILEMNVPDGLIVLVDLPTSGGGQTIDEGEDVPEYSVEFKKAVNCLVDAVNARSVSGRRRTLKP